MAFVPSEPTSVTNRHEIVVTPDMVLSEIMSNHAGYTERADINGDRYDKTVQFIGQLGKFLTTWRNRTTGTLETFVVTVTVEKAQ